MDWGKVIVTVINALGTLGETGAHYVLDGLESFVTSTATPVDNTLFYKVVSYVQSWQPKKNG